MQNTFYNKKKTFYVKSSVLLAHIIVLSETVWQNGNYNDTGEFTFTNLEPDNVYEFEICALGPNGIASGWSRATPIYVS